MTLACRFAHSAHKHAHVRVRVHTCTDTHARKCTSRSFIPFFFSPCPSQTITVNQCPNLDTALTGKAQQPCHTPLADTPQPASTHTLPPLVPSRCCTGPVRTPSPSIPPFTLPLPTPLPLSPQGASDPTSCVMEFNFDGAVSHNSWDRIAMSTSTLTQTADATVEACQARGCTLPLFAPLWLSLCRVQRSSAKIADLFKPQAA